jgi:hypothetical protein
MRTPLPCPGCGGGRKPRTYLCGNCWWLLKPWVRESLRLRDNRASLRLLELRNRIADGVPLEDLEVTR